MAENATERVLRYLVDAHAAEVGGLESLKDLANQATDPDIKSAVEMHITQTQAQIEQLHARIGALGGHDSGGKNALNSVLAKGSNLLNAFHDVEDKQTQDLIKAFSFEYFEVGMYSSLKAYAGAVGDTETAQLADTLLQQEKQTGEKFGTLIPQAAVAAVGNTYGTPAAV